VVSHPEQFCSGGCWSLIHALRLLGHQVSPVNMYDDNNEVNDPKAAEQLRHLPELTELDAVLVFDTGRAKINWHSVSGREDLPIIYHAGDDPMRHDANTDAIASGHFDAVLCAQRPFVEKYAMMEGIQGAEWMPYHHDGLLHFPEPLIKDEHQVVHSGKVYGLREPMLEAFIVAGLRVHCTSQWGHAYRASLCSATVGWHQAWCAEVGYRHFEWPAMGKLLICDGLEEEYGLNELYPDGTIVTYSGASDEDKIGDATSKILHYANPANKAERDAIAARGRDHSLLHHGPLARAKQLVDFTIRNFGS